MRGPTPRTKDETVIPNSTFLTLISRIHDARAEFDRAETILDTHRSQLGEAHPTTNAARISCLYREEALYTLLEQYRRDFEHANNRRATPAPWATDRVRQEAQTENGIAYFEVYEIYQGRDPNAGRDLAIARMRAA